MLCKKLPSIIQASISFAIGVGGIRKQAQPNRPSAGHVVAPCELNYFQALGSNRSLIRLKKHKSLLYTKNTTLIWKALGALRSLLELPEE
jgi:hypothetical protein